MTWSEERKREARAADQTNNVTSRLAHAAVAVEDALRSLEGVTVLTSVSVEDIERSNKYLHALYEIESLARNYQGGVDSQILSIIKAALPALDAPVLPDPVPTTEADVELAEAQALEEEYTFGRWVENTKAAIEQESI